MKALADWFDRIFEDGVCDLSEPLEDPARDRSILLARLRRRHEQFLLDLAGPPVPFVESTAWDAMMCLVAAAEHLRDADSPQPIPTISWNTPRNTQRPDAATLLSVDLTLQFVPVLWKRLRHRNLESPCVAMLESVLRQWPLSGILADLDGTPSVPLDFDQHSGIEMLYAERLAQYPRPGWVPPSGRSRECVELLFARLGRLLPAPLTEIPGDG
jgi:hypothetical protein